MDMVSMKDAQHSQILLFPVRSHLWMNHLSLMLLVLGGPSLEKKEDLAGRMSEGLGGPPSPPPQFLISKN